MNHIHSVNNYSLTVCNIPHKHTGKSTLNVYRSATCKECITKEIEAWNTGVYSNGTRKEESIAILKKRIFDLDFNKIIE